MKRKPPDSRNALSALRLSLALSLATLIPLLLYGSAPSWWSQRGVLIENATPDDYAPANQGQLKNIVKAAVAEMDARLTGGAGDELHQLVNSWAPHDALTNDFAPINLGQLKNVAKPFYDRLIAAGLAISYPWASSINPADDFGVANIGQVKNLFSFELGAANIVDDALADRLAASQHAGNLALETQTVWYWGNRFGVSSTFQSTFPQRLIGLPALRSVSIGDDHLVVLAADGTVMTWGKNNLGQLGDGTNVDRATAAFVPTLANIVSVKAGAAHTLALQPDGTLLAWGDNYYGQLGTGDTTPSSVPAPVIGLTNVRKIAAGPYRSVALKSDGTVWTWGYEHYDNGRDVTNPTPAQMADLFDVVDIAAGYEHVVAVKADGTVWAWGSNYSNQLGNGNFWWQYQATPFQVPNLANVVKVASSWDHSLALLNDGTVWAWGANNFGQLGDGTTQARQAPVQVSGLTNVIALATSYSYSMAMKADGTVWAWGEGASGTLSGVDLHVPQQVGLGLFDTNHNRIDDRWEMEYFGKLDATAASDFDGDGISDLQEFLRGTDPTDFFNGTTPVIEIVSGNNQFGDAGTTGSHPLTVRVKSAQGQLAQKAPVSFTVSSGDAQLITASGPSSQSIVRTDANGMASGQFLFGQSGGASSRVTALAGKSNTVAAVTFRVGTKYHPSPTPNPTPDPNATPTPTASPTATPSPTPTPSPPYRYAIIDLGKNVIPIRINNKGWVLQNGPDAKGNWGYYRWKGGTLEPLAYPGVHPDFVVVDMNDEGTVVGWEGDENGNQDGWVTNGANEFETGLEWPDSSSVPTKVSGPAKPSWNQFREGTMRLAFLSAISNRNSATNKEDVYGSVYTGGGYMWFWYLDIHNIMNAQRWSGDFAESVPLSFSSSTTTWNGGAFPVFDWQRPMDRVSRANSSRHYIGQRKTPVPGVSVGGISSGMVDGKSVDFGPIDLNEEGIVVGSRGSTMVIRTSDSLVRQIDGVYPVAINDHTRPAATTALPPDASPTPTATPIRIPQILGWDGSATVMWERQPDGQTWQAFGLEEMIPNMDGWEIWDIKDMNDSGAIIGQGRYTDSSNPHAQGEYHGFLLVPIELMVDGNRDGEMSFDNAAIDRTADETPYRFWLNTDHDIYHTVDGDDTEYDDASDGSRDCDYSTIYNMRDLEDFTRLRISFKGLTDLIKNVEYSVSLEWRSNDGGKVVPATDGAPEIVLYQEKQVEVRPLYLEDEVAALAQVRSPYDTWIGSVKSGQSVDLFALRPALRTALSEETPFLAFLFCGKNAGRGQLLVTVKKDGKTVMESPPLYVELLDIKDMYERWTVGDIPGTDPEVLPLLSDRSLPAGYSNSGRLRPFAYRADDREESQYVLFVHGWNVRPEEKDQFAETAYKRLFWQGYKGRFGVFEWPTTYGFGALLSDDTKWKNGVNGIYSAASDPTNYDRGEWSAWRSGLGLKRLLSRLNHNYPGNVYMFAHSMGNVVAGEALRMAAQEGLGFLVNTYVASQGAVPVHCYAGDQNAPLEAQVPAESLLRMFDGGYPETPNVYSDWLATNASSVERRINFFNVNDYALWNDVWQLNQYFKPDRQDPPDLAWTYRYNGQPTMTAASDGFRKDFYDPRNAAQDIHLELGDASDVKDRYEIMSFAAEARSKALGGTADVNALTDNINLQSLWPPDTDGRERPYSSHKWHSAEFRSTNMRQRKYWQTILGSRAFNILPERP